LFTIIILLVMFTIFPFLILGRRALLAETTGRGGYNENPNGRGGYNEDPTGRGGYN
jgi:hypothetical protein